MNFYNWLIKSSADPEKFSMTIKGILLACVPIVATLLTAFFGLDIDQSSLINLVSQLCIAIGSLLAIFGGIRKIVLTVKNK